VSTDFLAPIGIDLAKLHGYTVVDVEDDDPLLLDTSGRPVDTWREGYPYDSRMDVRDYDLQKRLLQIELLKARAGRSSASPSTSTPAAPGSSHWRSPASASRPSGTSSGTCSICRPPARS
jgi:hypothetical protein